MLVGVIEIRVYRTRLEGNTSKKIRGEKWAQIVWPALWNSSCERQGVCLTQVRRFLVERRNTNTVAMP